MHDELRQRAAKVWKELRKRDHSLAKEAADVIAEAMKIINKVDPPTPRGELEPLHRFLILCCRTKVVKTERVPKEMTAYKRVKKMNITDEDKRVVRQLYKARKSEKQDETWNRRSTPTILMNDLENQIELAHAWDARNKNNETPARTTPKEPDGWRALAPGAFQDEDFSSWFLFWRDYNDRAVQILEDLKITHNETTTL